MGREAEVSYEQVSEIVAELRRDGKKPTARAVRRAAGDKGSLTTILDHLHRLEESEKVAESVTFRDVPIALRTALFAFANAELDQYRQQVEALVEGAKQTVKEVCDENERLRDRSAATELKTQSLETKCSTLIGRCDQMQSELAKLQDELGKERAAAQLTITRLALADNELKHLDSLKHELVQVKADLINHRDARVEVEKEVAVLRALHAAHADQRIHAQHGRDHQATASPTGQGGKPTGRRGRTPSSSAGETDMSGTPVRTLSESDALSPNCGVDDRQKSLVLLDDGAEALAE